MSYIFCRKFPKEWDKKYVLECTHSYNSRAQDNYLMYCNVLKEMPNGRLKVRVFGYRWKNVDGEKIRYVDSYRVSEVKYFKHLSRIIEEGHENE